MIVLDKKEFEYDVYTLVMAFYPGSSISTVYTWDALPDEKYDFTFTITGKKDGYEILASDGEGCQVESATRDFPVDAERAERKNAIKQLVYLTLSKLSGKTLPWGDLTGIRPVKIPMKLLDEGVKNVDIAAYMRKTYFTSPEKTALSIAVANRERAILSEIEPSDGYSLYVGIPFCPSICLYCSFGSHPYERFSKYVQPYLDALYKELLYISRRCEGKKLQTVYFGGGTPTTLSASELYLLISFIKEHFSFENVKEFTVEAGRPDTITEEKLRVLKDLGVGRISVNPQTMNQKTLDIIGRNHTVNDVRDAFFMARQAGFNNINMDLIAGLPSEGPDEVAYTLEEIKKLSPDSLTIHSLALKRSTRLNLFKDIYEPVSFENSEEIMRMAGRTAAELSMEPYYLYRQKNMAGNLENVGYAKHDCFGIYNILIMEERQTILAAGSGASTKFVYPDGRIERVENVKDIFNYIERIDEMIERKEKQFLCS